MCEAIAIDRMRRHSIQRTTGAKIRATPEQARHQHAAHGGADAESDDGSKREREPRPVPLDQAIPTLDDIARLNRGEGLA